MNDEDEQPPSTHSYPRALLKVGGEVIADRAALLGLLAEVRHLSARGWSFAVVHGAGPQAGELQQRLGLPTQKLAGRRVTDPATLQVVKLALGGEVHLDVVAAGRGQGLRAVGISGVSGLVTARVRPPQDGVDFGLVGDVCSVEPELIEQLWRGGFTPIINPLSLADDLKDPYGTPQILNVNADSVACAVARALRVDHLFLVTSVAGVFRSLEDPTSRLSRLTVAEANAAIRDGVIGGGMIPKVEDALPLLRDGVVKAVHILGPRGLLEEAQEPGRLGTVLVADHASEDAAQ